MDQNLQNMQSLQGVGFAPPESEKSAWSTLAFAWRRKGLVAFCLILGVGLGYLYFLRQDPLYRASTQVVVIEEQLRLPISGLDMQTSTQEMHVTLFRSEHVIDKAVEIGKLNELPTLRNSGNAAGVILSRLSVSGSGNNKGAIVDLTYTSSDPDECPKVLQAVVTAYEQFLDEMYEDVSQETIELIQQAKDQLEVQISALESDLRKMLDESPLLVTGETALNIHEMRLKGIENVRSEALLENSRLQAKIDSLQNALKRGGSREALNLLIGHIENSTVRGGFQAEDRLFPMLLEEQMLLENYGPDHPKIQALLKRIEFTRKHFAMGSPTGDEQPVEERDYYDIYLESIREQIRMNQQTITEMTSLFDAERDAAKGLSTYQVQEEMYRSGIDRKSRLFDVVLKRLEEISLVQNRGGAEIRMVHPPHRGGQVQPDLKATMLQAIMLSLLAGLGIAFLVDSADRRFRSPDEIRNDLGVPIVGHIPVIPSTRKLHKGETAETDALPNVLRTVHAPRGRIAEAYRAVRTSIYFSTRGGGHQVIQVTSPTSGDGKTTLAGNLAVSVANSGKRVLLVDADFRRPRCHKLFGLENEIGVNSVLEDTLEWRDAVQSTQVENLSVMTCGPRPSNPSELVTSKRFAELLEIFRENYELVIVDTPPVMAVTDPLNVAPRVDGVIIVLRLSKNVRSSAKRTLDALNEVGSNVLGVVVNGVGQGQQYGGYGGTGYRYVYSSEYGYGGNGYGYGYGYGYGNDRSYYSDDADDQHDQPSNGRLKVDTKPSANGNGKV